MGVSAKYNGLATVFVVAILTTIPVRAVSAAYKGHSMYERTLMQAIDGIKKDLPSISASATQAADLYVRQNYAIGAAGYPGFVWEATGRAGGIINMDYGMLGNSKWKGILLYGVDDSTPVTDIPMLSANRAQGCKIVAFGRPAVVDRLTHAGAIFDWVINNHAAPGGGVYSTRSHEELIPTDEITNMVTLWTWVSEFVAACTRLDKMPPMWQSIMVPGGMDRDKKFIGLKFHKETPVAVPAQKLGLEYLSVLKKKLIQVLQGEQKPINRAAEMVVQTLNSGHSVYALYDGHALPNRWIYPHDPKLFVKLVWDPKKPDSNTPLTRGDMVLYMGYDQGPGVDNFASVARARGVGLVWSFAPYRKEEVAAIKPGEVYINQHWKLGDAEVTLPGYDIKIIPASGVIEDAIVSAIEERVLRLQGVIH